MRILPNLLLKVLSQDCSDPLISYYFQVYFEGFRPVELFFEFETHYSTRLWLKVDESFAMRQQMISLNYEVLAVASF